MTSKSDLYNRLTTEIAQNHVDHILRNNAEIRSAHAHTRVGELQEENARLQDEINMHKRLLCRPMEEIAAKNGNFAETYRLQQELIANWIVSQKAFKELAIEFGLEKGLTQEEVRKMGKEKEIKVLENAHNPLHQTNASDNSILNPLKDKYLKNRK
jgi:hypothetical protein